MPRSEDWTSAPKGPLTRRTALLGVVSAMAAAAAGCATQGPVTPSAAARPAEGEEGGPALPVTPAETEYRLGTGDELRVIVFGETELTSTYIVSSQGNVAFPLVGEVPATGLTLEEFTGSLRGRLASFIRQPIVSVEVANYRPFFILGEVQQPGTYPYSARLTVQNAVATAGGFTYRANQRRVFIKHANQDVEVEYELTSATSVLPGDTVRIAERRF